MALAIGPNDNFQETVREKSVMEKTINRLHQVLEQSYKNIDVLESRLKTVMCDIPVAEDPANGAPQPPKAPLVNEIESAGDRIQRMNEKLMYLINAIQL